MFTWIKRWWRRVTGRCPNCMEPLLYPSAMVAYLSPTFMLRAVCPNRDYVERIAGWGSILCVDEGAAAERLLQEHKIEIDP